MAATARRQTNEWTGRQAAEQGCYDDGLGRGLCFILHSQIYGPINYSAWVPDRRRTYVKKNNKTYLDSRGDLLLYHVHTQTHGCFVIESARFADSGRCVAFWKESCLFMGPRQRRRQRAILRLLHESAYFGEDLSMWVRSRTMMIRPSVCPSVGRALMINCLSSRSSESNGSRFLATTYMYLLLHTLYCIDDGQLSRSTIHIVVDVTHKVFLQSAEKKRKLR